MRIRRYNDGNVFSALVDKIKAAWAKWKGTLYFKTIQIGGSGI